MEKFKIQGEYITIQQFLKLLAYISSGGEAKYYLQEHKVYVNHEIEQRRGRKLYSNDIISLNGKEYQME